MAAKLVFVLIVVGTLLAMCASPIQPFGEPTPASANIAPPKTLPPSIGYGLTRIPGTEATITGAEYFGGLDKYCTALGGTWDSVANGCKVDRNKCMASGWPEALEHDWFICPDNEPEPIARYQCFDRNWGLIAVITPDELQPYEELAKQEWGELYNVDGRNDGLDYWRLVNNCWYFKDVRPTSVPW